TKLGSAAADDGVVVRGYQPGDEAAILAEMLATLARGEYEGMEAYQLESAAQRLPDEPDRVAVAELGGRLAGWTVPADDELVVVPEFRRRGVGRRLVAAARSIAAAQGRDELQLWVPHRVGAEAFALACGLRYTSSLWRMRLPPDAVETASAPVFPTGTRVRSLQPGVDDAAFTALVNRAFLDHPSTFHLTEDQVRRVHGAPGFDPGTILVVDDAATGEMVGFCRIVAYTSDAGRPEGEVRVLGVDRPWRGRGLGRAVTEWGVVELRRRGAGSIVLAVEGANERALRLYTDLGFQLEVEWPHWTIASRPDVA
ncbi:MAG TPA: GNAT family N-acetyltransferase, partial [Candidatus Limnocylindrales bacterium]